MSWLLVFPIVIPITTAVLAFLLRHSGQLERGISIAGTAVLLVSGVVLLNAVWSDGVLAMQVGDWPAPFGVSLVADVLAAVMVVVTGLTGLLIAIFALATIDGARQRVGFHSLYQVLLAGVCGAFLTGDLFNLYVWFEVMLIASFALMALGGERAQLDGAVKYAAINLVATILFLIAIGLLYGVTGTLNMAELHTAVKEVDNRGLLTAIACLFLVCFGIKAAVFPLFFWLPASYHTPPIAVTAIFSALMTKVGVYALFRMFTLVFTHDVAFTHTVILGIAILSMVVGVLGAAAQQDVRRILSFHIVSQIGYIVLGLALFTPLALAGAVFYLVHNIIAKTNLFLVGGVMNRLAGSFDLAAIGGLYRYAPVLAALFLLSALSLAGLPPLSGFWAKLLLVQASLEIEAWIVAGVALTVGLLTLYSMTKIWTLGFWKPEPVARIAPPRISGFERLALYAPIVAMSGLTVIMGLWAEPFLAAADRAAEELLDPRLYLDAVLGGSS